MGSLPREVIASQPPMAARHDPTAVRWLLVGTFVIVLDFFIVDVAIPVLQHGLHATSADIQLILAGFALAYAAGLIIGGRVGDRFGRKRTFIAGLALFTFASVVRGVAPSALVLVIARVVQGVAAALLSPQVLATFASVLESGARARAVNAYGVTMGVASVFAQTIGGVLIRFNLLGWGWRWCFLVNVPIGVAGIVMVARVVPESYAPRRDRLDIPGMVLIATALTALTLPLIEGREQGWPAWSWWCLAGSLPMFALFVAWEQRVKRRGGVPLIDPALFRQRILTVGVLAQVTFYMSMAGFYLVLAIYLQQGRGLDALGAGLIFIANGAGYLATSSIANRVAATLKHQVIAVGCLLRMVGLGLLWLAVLTVGVHRSVGWLVPGLICNGAGTGLAVAPLASTVLSRVERQQAGAVSGVLTTGLQVGNAIGVALIGIIFYGVLTAGGAHAAGAPLPYGRAFAGGLAYLVVVNGALIALVQRLRE
ncbi:MAG TPA: MFS transporter [Gemmatimonadaceae bacterium]|nr:MFS transporter [Gemmatimonadaceae bacterium]